MQRLAASSHGPPNRRGVPLTLGRLGRYRAIRPPVGGDDRLWFLRSSDPEMLAIMIGVAAVVLTLQIVMYQRQTVAVERSESRVDPRQHLPRNAPDSLV